MNDLDLLILVAMTLTALWTVMGRSLLRAALGLALTSAILSIMIYRMTAPLAAAFELSVCSGLISVIFITTISLTQPLTMSEVYEHARRRISRFWPLPLILVFTIIIVIMSEIKITLPLPTPAVENDVRQVLWYLRPQDIIGQLAILLAGAYGVVILFREQKKK